MGTKIDKFKDIGLAEHLTMEQLTFAQNIMVAINAADRDIQDAIERMFPALTNGMVKIPAIYNHPKNED